ncbi:MULTISPECIES: acyl carrier protein [Streptomyces]|uniref:Acyl carrier protein n=1 Tax=Streptomyces acidicola TaxID=2596892 RepID=A0A5N8WPV7_9ACTN|nr:MULTISPECIES: acyl carrier protein [Streptomyces]MBA2811377.1 acyl carrier protein [Streptomyces sp. KM273126]MPY48856.1 acyl carrier protein [Streptomyces acidicola]
MQDFTLDDLRRVMRASVGVDDSVDLESDIAGTEFTDLGYDSLALLEIVAKIDKEYGTAIPEDAVQDLTTPGKLAEYVRGRLPGAVAS